MGGSTTSSGASRAASCAAAISSAIPPASATSSRYSSAVSGVPENDSMKIDVSSTPTLVSSSAATSMYPSGPQANTLRPLASGTTVSIISAVSRPTMPSQAPGMLRSPSE